jgi:hypothetical protein
LFLPLTLPLPPKAAAALADAAATCGVFDFVSPSIQNGPSAENPTLEKKR